MILNLLKSRRFGPFATQFLGAFNDNVFKNALGILIAFRLAGELALSSNTLVNLSFLVFIFPPFCSRLPRTDSRPGGEIGFDSAYQDRGDFGHVAGGSRSGSWQCLPAVFSAVRDGHADCFFGPVKYGILPQHLKEELVGGNGPIEMGTFLAILLGTLLGVMLIAYDHGQWFVAVVVVVVAVGGWASSRGVPIADASDQNFKFAGTSLPRHGGS